MVEVTYHCPYCGALTSLERDAYLDDKAVTKRTAVAARSI